jgi:NAD(P)H-dependent FMN reductase
MPRLMILVASTRPGRVGLPVARWLRALVEADGRFEVDFADLADIGLPFLDEPHHPRMRQYVHEHTKRWSARVQAAEAFAFVMPEYNYGFTAPLKNAIDYLNQEWRHKPVGLVSYGGVAGGTRAQQLLKPVLVQLRMTPAAESVLVPFVGRLVVDGAFRPDDATREAAAAMLDELLRLHRALAPLRAHPPG